MSKSKYQNPRPFMSKRHKRQRFYETMKIGYIRVSKHEQNDLIETLNLLDHRGIDFISLTENIDTTTPGGKLIFHLMGALAEFERDLIRERTNAGLAAARARGRVGGRPRKLATNGKVALALRLVEDSKHSIDPRGAQRGKLKQSGVRPYLLSLLPLSEIGTKVLHL